MNPANGKNAGRDVHRYIRQILYNIQIQPWSVKPAALKKLDYATLQPWSHKRAIPEPEDGKVRSTYSPPWAQKGFTGLIREAEECYEKTYDAQAATASMTWTGSE